MTKEVRFAAEAMPAAVFQTSPVMKTSPFFLTKDAAETLGHSDGFSILRMHLAEHYAYDLCESHTTNHREDTDRWTAIRDVLHALLVPVVELYDKASTIAEAAKLAQNLEDVEYAYTGSGRFAFSWLHCFLEKERDWCYTNGCPACVVEHALDSEFTIRMLFAACLLSDVHYPFTMEGPTLPSFMFFLESLDLALINDPLYGADFFELMQPKAVATRDGVEELIHQCLELEAVMSHPPSPNAGFSMGTGPVSPALGPLGGPGMRVKRSKMAKRQLKLMAEEGKVMEELRLRCYDTPMGGNTPMSGNTPALQSLDEVVERTDYFSPAG